jgi:ribosomal protein S18 acetylase RimI-like enzyme
MSDAPSPVIETVTEATDDVVGALAALIPQLSSSSPPPTRAEVAEMIADRDTHLFVARLEGAIVGTLTLAMFRIPTGLKAWIEDVVVDGSARGHGVGELLTRAALDAAAGEPHQQAVTRGCEPPLPAGRLQPA